MTGDSTRRGERRRVRRRSLLKRAGAAGIAGLAGCVRFDDGVEANGPAEELLRDGFDATGVEPPFSTTIAITQDEERERFAQLFRDELNGTGFFDVDIERREFGSHVDRMIAAADESENAMFVASWTGGWDPSDYVNILFHSDNHTPDGFNVNHYANERVDDRLDAGLEETDPDERVAIYREVQEELVADSPLSFVRFRESTHVWDGAVVTDWRTYPLRTGTYYGVYAPWAGVYTDLQDGTEFVGDLGSDVQNTDPVSMNDTASGQATVLLYEQLVGVDFEGEPCPFLADEWERLDETTYRFSLRNGVRFHNGERLTADHVKGSLERYEGTPRESDVYDWYDGSEIVDDTTIEISCWREYGPFENALFDVPIVPMAAIDGELDLESEPIGTGPYQLVEYESDNRWRMARFDDHWFDGDGTVPATAPIETVTLEIITEKSSRQAALEAGNVHFSGDVPSASLGDFEDDDAYGVGRHVGGGFDMVIYPSYRAPFSEQSVRRGCNMLLPRQTTLENVYHGVGSVAYTPISPLLDAYAGEAFQESIADEYVHPN
ncbi:ABC transporter substrate-binding protein [Natrinema salaciae]|uniref:Peptide/nickel transport system substrate-binding protein n=1 Tax=Natrinema salaciae TaxID=1186196 RepID=A0A1H9R435_9EURY|nr:ABC transporter substrate-binding protein [Natrinema salaciae]SER67496.1 peptide/nickel transport system substrate-binding protein [Natrinema salaciae]